MDLAHLHVQKKALIMDWVDGSFFCSAKAMQDPSMMHPSWHMLTTLKLLFDFTSTARSLCTRSLRVETRKTEAGQPAAKQIASRTLDLPVEAGFRFCHHDFVITHRMSQTL